MWVTGVQTCALPICLRVISSVEFEFFRSFGYPWEKRWFLVELQVSVEVFCVLEFLAEFRVGLTD